MSWGFDGRVVVGRFNLLLVEVRNSGDTAVDKHLRLTRSILGSSKGAPVVKRCYLSPGARKVLPLHPFIESESEVWTASWVEGGAAGMQAPGIRPSAPAQVILGAPTDSSTRLLIPTFDPAHLPTNATAMDALGSVLIDRVPIMNKLQRRALLDWVRGGGTLYRLLIGGHHLDFEQDLAALNSEQADLAFGAGRVHKCEFSRSILQERIPPALQRGFVRQPVGGSSLVDAFRRELRGLIQSQHSWMTLFLLSLVYLVLIGPVFYKLSAGSLRWNAGLVALFVVVVGASWLFMWIGQRGYLESDATHSIHYVQPLGGDMHDVTSYSNVFLTKGSNRVFASQARFGLFTSAQTLERVPAEVTNGVQAKYRVDIPQFSHRLVIHKRQVALKPAVFTLNPDTGEISSDLKVDAIVELAGKIVHWWVEVDGVWRRQRMFNWEVWQSMTAYRQEIEYRLLGEVTGSRICGVLRDPKKPLVAPGRRVFFVLLRGAPAGLDVSGAPITASARTIYKFDLTSGR